ncbi:uncharacterized protein LOC132749140 [Ruditapes philippinarum]|uniref:uncharacterized protein LOC132749140 n=1 Tax=Ruditapes philippinarum TaxID=129788 RepID=UPI00295BE7A8|nr:uncharacterized protein LOC132749140 [Ruditapes philippinarum]
MFVAVAVLLSIAGICTVHAGETRTNVAFKKPCTMSDQVGDYACTYGNDGNTEAGSCFQTKRSAKNFWRVDLEDTYEIVKIKIYSNLDAAERQGNNIRVFIGLEESDVFRTKVGDFQDLLDIQIIDLPPGTKASYVKIVQTAPEGNLLKLNLCEIQVFSPNST